jgi:drug/metabolite transporter (DMT)-like permease
LKNLILFSVIVLAGTGGELCVSLAMKRVGEATSFHPAHILRVVLRALTQPWMWAGVSMMALAFFALLGALSIYNVSFVVPVTALSYIAGALGGVLFLHEHVNLWRWMGVLLVAIGVTLVVLGKG